jgi:hypothetical protein
MPVFDWIAAAVFAAAAALLIRSGLRECEILIVIGRCRDDSVCW